MNNIVIKDNNPLVFSQKDDLSLTVESNLSSNIIINDFVGKNVSLLCKDNSHLKLLYFSSSNEEVVVNVNVDSDATLDFDVILMNQNVVDSFDIQINGSNSNVNLKILSLAKNAVKKMNVNVSHNAPYSTSLVSNNGISFENGENNFTVVGSIKGKMTGSDVRQLTKGLILSPTGKCLAEPILLIDYYDVKAYHGATIGKLNDEDLFYLMSRGLTKDEAFMLVINGILEPFIKDLQNEEIKTKIMNQYGSYFK